MQGCAEFVRRSFRAAQDGELERGQRMIENLHEAIIAGVGRWVTSKSSSYSFVRRGKIWSKSEALDRPTDELEAPSSDALANAF